MRWVLFSLLILGAACRDKPPPGGSSFDDSGDDSAGDGDGGSDDGGDEGETGEPVDPCEDYVRPEPPEPTERTLWTLEFDGDGPVGGIPEDVAVAGDGAVFVGGTTMVDFHTRHRWVRAHNADGAVLWDWRNEEPSGENRVENLAAPDLNGVIAAGSFAVGDWRGAVLARVSADGALVWEELRDPEEYECQYWSDAYVLSSRGTGLWLIGWSEWVDEGEGTSGDHRKHVLERGLAIDDQSMSLWTEVNGSTATLAAIPEGFIVGDRTEDDIGRLRAYDFDAEELWSSLVFPSESAVVQIATRDDGSGTVSIRERVEDEEWGWLGRLGRVEPAGGVSWLYDPNIDCEGTAYLDVAVLEDGRTVAARSVWTVLTPSEDDSLHFIDMISEDGELEWTEQINLPREDWRRYSQRVALAPDNTVVVTTNWVRADEDGGVLGRSYTLTKVALD